VLTWSDVIQKLCRKCIPEQPKQLNGLAFAEQPPQRKKLQYTSLLTFSDLIYKFDCKFHPSVLDADGVINALSELIKKWLFTFSFVSLEVYRHAILIAKIFNKMTRKDYVISKCREVDLDRVTGSGAKYSCGRAVRGLPNDELATKFKFRPDESHHRFNTRIIIYATVSSDDDYEDEGFYERIVRGLIEKEKTEIKENVDGVLMIDVPVTDVPVTDVPVTDVPVIDVPVIDVPVIDVPVTDVPVAEEAENKKMDGGGLYRYKHNKNKYLNLIRLRAKN